MKHRILWAAAALALWVFAQGASSKAKAPSMVDTASRLYKKATPASFDKACRGQGNELKVTGDRHECITPARTRIVEFAGEKPSNVTVSEKGIRKGVMGDLKRRFGAPDSAKTLGPMKMHFWFADTVRVSVAFFDSQATRSTMVRFESRN